MIRDKSIQIIRIIAMFSIILCHLMQEMDNGLLIKSAQFFNVGVYIFLFISGLLYGRKKIDNNKKWIIKRFKTIMIPIYIFIIVLSIILLFQNNFNFKYILIYLFDAQYFFGGTVGSGHLWFVTIIMICYLITLLLNKYKKLFSKKIFLFILVASAIIISIYSVKYSLLLWYIILYIIGYNFNEKKNYSIIFSIILFVISFLGRLISQKYFDGTFIYDGIFVPLFQISLAISIYLILKYLCLILEKLFDKFSKVINHLDSISYYIYISHYIFFVGPVRTLGITNNLLLNILITLVSSYIFALVLKYITDKINVMLKIPLVKN